MPHFDRIPKEYANNEACFVFVNEGSVSIRSPEKYVNLDKRTGVLAKCLNYFFELSENQKAESDYVEVVAVLLYPEVIRELFEFEVVKTNYTFDQNIEAVLLNTLLDNFRQSISILIDNPNIADEALIRTKLKEFILLMSKSQNAPSEVDFLAALFKPANIDFKNAIRQNLYANLSIDELAALTHLSTSSFKRKFKDVFEDSPHKYIAKKKVERALELLQDSELRISDVAYDVGFDSITTFNRNFSSITGKSPSDYRIA